MSSISFVVRKKILYKKKKINKRGSETVIRVSCRTGAHGIRFGRFEVYTYTYINYSPVSRSRVVYEARPSATCITAILFSDSFCVRGSCSPAGGRRVRTPECTRTRGGCSAIVFCGARAMKTSPELNVFFNWSQTK